MYAYSDSAITNPICIAGTDGRDATPRISFREQQVKEYSVLWDHFGKKCVYIWKVEVYIAQGVERGRKTKITE